MPNILALTDKKTGERYEGRGLITVDEKLCEALHVPCSNTEFYLGWVDWMPLYFTNDWQKAREVFNPENAKVMQVLDWLEKHYNLDGYAIIGRR